MTAPLPTLAEIDDLLKRSLAAEDLALSDMVDLWESVREIRHKRDAMLECRTQVAALRAGAA